MTAQAWRWKIARALDHLPGTCWADLVSWALKSDGYRLPCWQDTLCRGGSVPKGTCYCGKIKSPASVFGEAS